MLSDIDDDLFGSVHASPDLFGDRADHPSTDSEPELRFGASDGASAARASEDEALPGLESSLDELGLRATPERDVPSPDLLLMDEDGVDEEASLFATPVAWRSPATSPGASFVQSGAHPRRRDNDLLAFDDDDAGLADDEDLLDLDDDDQPPSDDDPLNFDERESAPDILAALRSLALDLIVQLSTSLCSKSSKASKLRYDVQRRSPIAIQLGVRSGPDTAGCADTPGPPC